MVTNQALRSAAVPGTTPGLNQRPAGQWRWLRLLLLVGALASGVAGQYWLSIYYTPLWSAAAWAAAVLCFVLLYALGPEAFNLPSPQDGVGSRDLEWGFLGVVLAVGVFIAVFRLREFPPGLNHDAAYEGLYALRILHGFPYTPYTAEAWGRETFTFYLRAISIWLLGPTRLAVTVPSTVAGVLILPFFFVWARRMFGLRFGLMATLFLGVSGWHLVFSRTGWRSDFQPLFMVITCCFFVRGMVTGSIIDFALSGLGLAASLNTYNGARLFPALFPLWVVAVVLQSWHWRGFLRRYGRGLLAMSIAFGIAVAPLTWYALHNWEVFQGRAHALAGVSTLAESLKATALLFNYRGNGDDFFINTPALEYPTAIFLVFGVLWALVKLGDERVQFVVLGLVINLVPGLVSKPNMNRDVGTMPFIYLFVAMGALFFAEQAGRLIPRAGRVIAAAVLVVAGISATQATYAQYLGQRARPIWGYYPETTVLGNYMKTLVPQYTIWVGGANFPRDALTYLSYTGQRDPMQRNYTWLDDVRVLLQMRPAPRPGRGMAFVLANEGVSATVLNQLEQRYPQHQVVDVRYPVGNGPVFAKALLIAPESAARTATAEAPPAIVEEAPPPAAAEPAARAASGELREPRGVAVTKGGNVLVCDFGNNRIEEFGRDLRVVRQWGELGDAVAQFKQPCGIAVAADGQIFVADTWNQRVQVFSPEGRFLRQWAAGFYGPRGIAVDATGTVFVADTGENRIVRFSAAGQKEKEWGGKGSEPGQFIEPVGITVDAAGQVYVCDNGNGRLQVFDRDGRFLSQFPVRGWESKVYSEPNVTLDPRGTIWVTVPGAKEVRNYDRSGKLLRTITGQSAGGAGFETPMGIAYSAATRELIVTDLNNRVVRIPDVTK
jgi:DNA-binding beta-propeller fold protein YncE